MRQQLSDEQKTVLARLFRGWIPVAEIGTVAGSELLLGEQSIGHIISATERDGSIELLVETPKSAIHSIVYLLGEGRTDLELRVVMETSELSLDPNEVAISGQLPFRDAPGLLTIKTSSWAWEDTDSDPLKLAWVAEILTDIPDLEPNFLLEMIPTRRSEEEFQASSTSLASWFSGRDIDYIVIPQKPGPRRRFILVAFVISENLDLESLHQDFDAIRFASGVPFSIGSLVAVSRRLAVSSATHRSFMSMASGHTVLDSGLATSSTKRLWFGDVVTRIRSHDVHDAWQANLSLVRLIALSTSDSLLARVFLARELLRESLSINLFQMTDDGASLYSILREDEVIGLPTRNEALFTELGIFSWRLIFALVAQRLGAATAAALPQLWDAPARRATLNPSTTLWWDSPTPDPKLRLAKWNASVTVHPTFLSDHWPVFSLPVYDERGPIGIVASFARELGRNTGELVQARISASIDEEREWFELRVSGAHAPWTEHTLEAFALGKGGKVWLRSQREPLTNWGDLDSHLRDLAESPRTRRIVVQLMDAARASRIGHRRWSG